MKKLISILLLVVLLTTALSSTAHAATDTSIGVEPGQTMPDFTVSLTDGTTATLSELLKEKDLEQTLAILQVEGSGRTQHIRQLVQALCERVPRHGGGLPGEP